MLYRQFYSWADTHSLLTYLFHMHMTSLGVCLPTLGPFHKQGLQSLEAIQKFACEV